MCKYLIIAFILAANVCPVWAHSANFWKSLNDDFIVMEMNHHLNPNVKSRYPKVVRFFLEGLIGWHPGTVWDKENRCSLSEFKNALYDEPVVSRKQILLQDFVQNCDPVYSKNNTLNALKIISQKGNFFHHPFFKYSFLNFSKSHKTRALWGFKSNSRRDLIVVRPGIYANVDELIAERYILFLLTEINDYHVVVLESSTSGEHFHNNDQVMIGGAKEAYENLFLSQHIRKHPVLSNIVNKIHIMGISLGANGVLLSSLVNQKQDKKYFDKTFLFCPVVDLPASFAAQMGPGFRPYLMDLWSSHRLEDLQGKKGFRLQTFFESLVSLTPRWVRGAWSWFEKGYSFRPEWQKLIPEEFYSGNFKTDYAFFKNDTVLPDDMYVFSTKVDPIVFPEMNYDRLAQKAHEKTFFFKFEDGFHCSFAYTFQWKFLDALFSGLVGRPTEPRDPSLIKDKSRYELTVEHQHRLHDTPLSDKPRIRSVEVSKLETNFVELLVYFSIQTDLSSGHVKIPLEELSLDEHYVDYDSETIRNYIKRMIQTQFKIERENTKFFIKI